MKFKRQRVGKVPLLRKKMDGAREIRIVGRISWWEYCRMREYMHLSYKVPH